MTDVFHDVTRFSMADMAVCSSDLRRMGRGAASMQEVAESIVNYLYGRFTGGPSAEKAFALVRLFKTQAYGELTPALRAVAQSLVGADPRPSMKCLTLLATAGDRREWCSPSSSEDHKTIPLVSEGCVARIPMIAGLVKQFGLEIPQMLQPGPNLLADLSQRTFNVFHVAEAVGSPSIPAQQDFVIPAGIRSCLGFGGMLPRGDLFALIMFSRVSIPYKTAAMFKTLSLSVKSAILPFESKVLACVD